MVWKSEHVLFRLGAPSFVKCFLYWDSLLVKCYLDFLLSLLPVTCGKSGEIPSVKEKGHTSFSSTFYHCYPADFNFQIKTEQWLLELLA